MKTLSLFFASLFSTLMMANNSWACGEAVEVVGIIGSAQFDISSGCHVTFERVNSYSMGECSMDVEEVLAMGFQVAVANGHECSLHAGDEFDGVVVNYGGKLWDEKALVGVGK